MKPLIHLELLDARPSDLVEPCTKVVPEVYSARVQWVKGDNFLLWAAWTSDVLFVIAVLGEAGKTRLKDAFERSLQLSQISMAAALSAGDEFDKLIVVDAKENLSSGAKSDHYC